MTQDSQTHIHRCLKYRNGHSAWPVPLSRPKALLPASWVPYSLARPAWCFLQTLTGSSCMHSTRAGSPRAYQYGPLATWYLGMDLRPLYLPAEVYQQTSLSTRVYPIHTRFEEDTDICTPQQLTPGTQAVTSGPAVSVEFLSHFAYMGPPQELVLGTQTVPTTLSGS